MLNTTTSYMQRMVNDMSTHFGCGDQYAPEFVTQLQECLTKWDDPRLEEAVNNQWEGFVEYFQNTSDTDPWVDCLEDSTNSRCTSHWAESKMERWSVFGNGTDREIVVMEPCNYASTIAYYHATLRMCEYDGWGGGEYNMTTRRALKRSFATHAIGSAFMHASHTDLGGLFDNLLIAIIINVSYDDLVTALGWSSDNVLRCLDEDLVCDQAADLAEQTSLFSLDRPVHEWYEVLQSAANSFQSNYEYTFAAIVYVVVTLAFPPIMADAIISLLANALLGDSSGATFLWEVYAPKAKPLLENVRLDKKCKRKLRRTFWGTSFKILYAFLFQEQLFGAPSTPLLWFGFNVSPVLNVVFTFLNGFWDRSTYTVTGRNLYPGDEQCNVLSPHAFWHQQSAEGFLDIIFMSDYLATAINGERQE